MSSSKLFDEWSTYGKVVTNDYMHHGFFLAALASEIEAQLQASIAIVDLGCGDCASIIPFLDRVDAKRYTGIDQSESALVRANSNLGASGVPFALRCGSMPEDLGDLAGSFNLAVASYSLNHLRLSEKQAVLDECRRLLEPGGLLAIVDVFLDENESRQAYFHRWETNARRAFAALDAEEIEELLGHVRECDVPETVATYRKLGHAAGFDKVRPIARDAERLNRLIVLS